MASATLLHLISSSSVIFSSARRLAIRSSTVSVLWSAAASAFWSAAVFLFGEHRESRGHRVWTGGYYGAPPVVYGNPYVEPGYYYPPPVVYGPAAGLSLNLPGVSLGLGIR